MTFKTYLDKYYTQLEKTFHKHHKAILNDPEPDSIEQLRENIKRQKAFYNLLLSLDPTFHIEKVTPALNEFYHQMDSLRALQVEEEILLKEEHKLHISHTFSNVVHREEQANLEALRQFEKEFPLRPIWEGSFYVRNSIAHLTDEKVCERLPIYFKDLKKNTALQAGLAKLENELLKDVKKQLNELRYNWELISEYSLHTSRKNVSNQTLPVIDVISDYQKYLRTLQKAEAENYSNRCLKFVLRKDTKKAKKVALKSLETIPYLFRSFDYGLKKMIQNMKSAEALPSKFSNTPMNLQEGRL